MLKRWWFALAVLADLTLSGWGGASAEEVSLATLEKWFRELPVETRRWTGPLFWLHGDESRERLEMYVGKVAEGGNGCFTAESRPHTGWLEESWFRDLAVCLDAAKRNNLKMWIFDEKWWPSGEVGGKVPAEHGGKRLVAATIDVEGPRTYRADGYGEPSFIAAVAGREGPDGLDGASLIDLAPAIGDGTLRWDVPPGRWKLIKFTWKSQPAGGRYLIDGASQQSVDWYIRTVYQPHYDRFKDDFGTNILGFFYDEPEIKAEWGTEVLKILAERGVDWKKALVAFKFKLAGEEQVAALYQYLDAFAEAWGRTMYGGLSRWCRERGMLSIGHFLEHRGTYSSFDLCAGDMFKLQKYSDMGGVDLVFSQLKPGQRVAYDAPCWQVPKIGSSISHVYGKPDDVAMVEIFGARGQDLSYPEMKWWTDHVQVSGVNFFIPHSFNPRAPRDTDCPPYFYNGGFEPRWPLYRVFADYTSRLTLMLTGGRHVCPVALLYVGQSAHVGQCILPDAMSEALQDALFDCDWMPYEVFEDATELAGKTLRMRQESFRVLVVPPVEVIPYATLAKAKNFFESGGVVVGYGFLPSKSATPGRTAADIARLRETIWGDATASLATCRTSGAGGRSYLLPQKPTAEQLHNVLAEDAGIHPTLEVIEGQTDHWLHVLHRVKAGCELFFITNQNHLGEARRFRFRITADGEPECWDAMRNEITGVPCVRQGRQVELTLTFEPSESVLLVFQPRKRPLPARLEPNASPPTASIAVVRDSTPTGPAPKLDMTSDPAAGLEGCPWIWYPEGNPAANASPGQYFFRKGIALPEGESIKTAVFSATADNSFVLYVNGQEAGHGDNGDEGWRNPVQLEINTHLHGGANVLAIAATNAAGTGANPAGLIGRLSITFGNGRTLDVMVDGTWKASPEGSDDWLAPGFNDATWKTAKEIARFGDAPWGRLNSNLTLSPVQADPFIGHCEIPANVDLAESRVHLEMDALAPEEAARITVNDQDAGGFIGRPLRLEVTQHLKSGPNTVKIEPFAPASARLVFRPR